LLIVDTSSPLLHLSNVKDDDWNYPFSAILIMSNVASNERTNEAASLDDDAPGESNDTTPALPINVISHWVLPFVQDRLTWNAVCSANKELHGAGMRMTPPWPETKLTLLGQSVTALKFSPCGSFLASGSGYPPYPVHVCDRRGSLTRLIGHNSGINHLSFSKDGKYLASANPNPSDLSIRIWPTNSTRVPQQSDKKLLGHQDFINCLDFSPDDSNLLASADYYDIKLWNVEQEVCTHSFNRRYDAIRSLCFLPARENPHTCIFVTFTGSLIRICWDDLSSVTNDTVAMPGLGEVHTSAFSHCGSLLAAASPDGEAVVVILYNMRTMAVVQRISIGQRMPKLAFSPNGKTLLFALDQHEVHICEVHDLNIRRRLGEHVAARAVAFDPSSQFLASVGLHQDVRISTL
jgi:COMPASS component SWD3